MNFEVIEIADKYKSTASGVIDNVAKGVPKDGVIIFDSNWFKGIFF